MKQLLIICGPTATGKTSLALRLANTYKGSLISADSRQVYKGMSIGTGKDLPANLKSQIPASPAGRSNLKFETKKIPYYTIEKTNIWGYDLVNPDEEFSVSHYRDFAIPLIEKLWAENKLPIVVGGTGLYIKALLEPIETITIPTNKFLRTDLSGFSTSQLQQQLIRQNEKRFLAMNYSDQNNPRRLVRAIEVELWKKKFKKNNNHKFDRYYQEINPLVIGLTADKKTLSTQITNRIDLRMDQGIISEIKTLRSKGYDWKSPAFSALGYRLWQDYFETGEKVPVQKEVIKEWKKEEIQFAKRQLTWFKKQEGIIWFDISLSSFPESVLDVIEKWYTKK